MSSVPCTRCQQSCYPLEKVVLGEKPFHRNCAKCFHCSGQLSLSSFSILEGNLYCKPHFMELFKASGGKYTFGDAPAPTTVITMESTKTVQPTPQVLLKPVPSKNQAPVAIAEEVVKPMLKPVQVKGLAAAPSGASQPKPVQLKSVAQKPADFAVEESKPVVEKKPKPAVAAGGNRLAAFLNQEEAKASASVPQLEGKKNKLSEFLCKGESQSMVDGTKCVDEMKPVVVVDVKPVVVEVKPVAPSVVDVKPVVPAVAPTVVDVKPVVAEAPKVEMKPVVAEMKPVVQDKVQVVVTQPAAAMDKEKSQELVATACAVVSKVKLMEDKLKKMQSEYESKLKFQQLRIEELENECVGLRQRMLNSDAGKEGLVEEMMKWKQHALTMNENQRGANATTTTVGAAGAAARPPCESSLKRAKQLLAQGKITKKQYEAATKAALEADKVASGAI
jgi:hypothetical protein